MATAPIDLESSARLCAGLLLRLHELGLQGKASSPEAAAACQEMEAPWRAMSEEEQERLGGLSEDLFTLEEGGARQVAMTPEERQRWAAEAREVFTKYRAGDYDRPLVFLRRSVPSDMEPQAIPYLQSRCWQELGDVGVAIVFMKEAERIDPSVAVHVLTLLRQAKREEEAVVYANRVVDRPESSPMSVYVAAGVLLAPTQGMSDAEAKPTLQRLVPPLRRALQKERELPGDQRELDRGEASLAVMLGLCLERLGDTRGAIRVYAETLSRYPDDGDLLTMRGVATFETDHTGAMPFFRRAVRANAGTVWPYYVLANWELRRGNYFDAWKLCLRGLERRAPPTVQAQLHEWLGISRSMLGQPIDLVLDSFDRADELDPGNARIRRNRAVAEGVVSGRTPTRQSWGLARKADLSRSRWAVPVNTRHRGEAIGIQQGDRFADRFASAGS